MERERLRLGRIARPAALMIAAVIKMIWFAFARTACLSGTNPKNIGLLASACLVIAQSGLSAAQAWIVLAVFVVVSCISVIVPVLH